MEGGKGQPFLPHSHLCLCFKGCQCPEPLSSAPDPSSCPPPWPHTPVPFPSPPPCYWAPLGRTWGICFCGGGFFLDFSSWEEGARGNLSPGL